MAGVDPHKEFRLAVERPEEDLDLGRAALLIAQPEYPKLDIDAYLVRIDALAVEVSRHATPGRDGVHRSIAALNYVLFREKGFTGNVGDYFDDKNSFLNEVLERRTGIPITLCVLYMEVARRIGLPLLGVGFPGHFLVKYMGEFEEIVVDAFNGGEIKTEEELQRLLDRMVGARVPLDRRLLAPVTKKQIIRRMLNNLKFIYLKRRDLVKALAALDRMLVAEPDAAEDLRERGYIYRELEYFPQAAADLERYLQVAPDAPDASQIHADLAELAVRGISIH